MITKTQDDLVKRLAEFGHRYKVGFDDGHNGAEMRSKHPDYVSGYREGWKKLDAERRRIG